MTVVSHILTIMRHNITNVQSMRHECAYSILLGLTLTGYQGLCELTATLSNTEIIRKADEPENRC